MAGKNENDVIPAGSGVPEASGEAPVEQNTPNTPAEDTGASGKKADDKGSDDLTSLREQLANAEKLIGRQGKELGELRNEYKAMSEAAAQQADNTGNKSYETRLGEIQQQVDNGEIDFGAALRLTAQLSAEMGASQATNDITSRLQQDKQNEVQAKFLADNPDFETVSQDGTLDEIMKSNPMHDKFSAYYEYRNVKLQEDMAKAVEAARAEGEQKGVKERESASNAENVLGKKGANVRDTNKPKSFANAAERKQAMIDALKASRSV